VTILTFLVPNGLRRRRLLAPPGDIVLDRPCLSRRQRKVEQVAEIDTLTVRRHLGVSFGLCVVGHDRKSLPVGRMTPSGKVSKPCRSRAAEY